MDNNTDFIPDGHRVIKSENGDVYVGILKQGVFEGIGTVIFKDGSIFTGALQGSEPNGQGIVFFNDRSIYSGLFTRG